MPTRFAYPNRTFASGVVVSATSAAALRPASYLLSPWRSKAWRSATNTSSQRVTFDLGSARTFRALFVMDVKLHAGGTLRAQANSADSWGAPPVNELLPAPSARTKLTGVWLAGQQTYRYVSLFFDNVAAVSEYVEAAVYFVAPYLEPAIGIRDDVQFRHRAPARVTFSADGQRQAITHRKHGVIEGALSELLLADADALVAMHDELGQDQPVLATVEPTDLEQTLYGFLMEELVKQHEPQSVGRYTVPLALEEAR